MNITNHILQATKQKINNTTNRINWMQKKNPSATSKAKNTKKRIFAFIFIITIGTIAEAIKPAQAQKNQVKDQFRELIYKGCLNSKGSSKLLCSCYSTRISRRYNSQQAIAIYRLSSSSDDARKMFFLTHSPEYAFCKR